MNNERSEYTSAGSPRDEARAMRREGLAERAGLTGGYVEPGKRHVAADQAADDHEFEARKAALDAYRRRLT